MPRPARKTQQRLTFTPIPSSSPAAKGYHKQVQERAAAVTLEASPSSIMRKARETVDLISDDEVSIPTPAASPDLTRENDQNSDSENEPAHSTQRLGGTRIKRPRQQRLDFTKAREPASFDSPIRLPSTARTRSSNPVGMFSSQVLGQVGLFSDEDSNDGSDHLPSPRKMLKANKRAKRSTSSSGNKDKEKTLTRTSQATVGEELDDNEIGVAGSRQKDPPVQPEEDSGDDTDMPTTQRRRKARQPQPVGSISGSPMRVNDDEDNADDTDVPTTQGKRQRKRKRTRRNSFISDSPPLASESDDDVTITGSRKRVRIQIEDGAPSEDDDNDEEDEEDALPKTPGRRRLDRPRKELSQREKEDLEEDLNFLGPSDDDAPSSRRAPRNTQSAQKSAKQQALERLKRARAGQEDLVENLQEEEDEDEGHGGNDEEDEDVAEDEVVNYTSSRQFFQERDEDAEFVEEEEEDGPLGVPAGIPLEFTRYASLKPKELFKYAVDWMLQKHINPGFQKRDALYDLTFRKLDDEAQGLAGSKFKSSAWTPAFRYALEARPQMDVHELDSIEMEDHDKCDACNRSSHQCTFKVRFHGKPYHNDTLEEITSDDDDSDSDDDASHASHVDYNANGIGIASTGHFFFIGKFCKSNASTSHALQHWRFHLNEFVHGYLETAGYFKANELEKRQGWSIKKLGKYASKVLTGMERDGEVSKLWKMFRSNIDEARESKGGRYRGNSP